jgi:hypothetical protein
MEMLKEVSHRLKVLGDGACLYRATEEGAAVAKVHSVQRQLEHEATARQLGASEVVIPLHIDGESEVVQHTISKCPSFAGRTGGTGHGALKSEETRSRNSVRLGRKKGQVCRKLC